jgi:hypothetical protein
MIPANWQSGRASGHIRDVNGQYPTVKVGFGPDSPLSFQTDRQELRGAKIRLSCGSPYGSAGYKENQRTMKLHSWIVGAIAAVALLAAPPVKAQSSLAAAEATAFLGTWTITLDSPQGPFEQVLELKDAGGKVSGQITSAIAPEPTQVTDISKDGQDLVLKFNGDFQGTAFTAKITMSMQGADKAKATFDVMDGQFVMDGTAVKK